MRDLSFKKFDSFADADEADYTMYSSMPSAEKMQIFLELLYTQIPLNAQYTKRLERVFRVFNLGEC
jgi:hypothetical protein